MGPDHFDDVINGCPGGQFMEAPPFAFYTIFPFLRWQIFFYLFRIPFYLFIICGGLYLSILALASLAFSIACFPFSIVIVPLANLCCDVDMRIEFFCMPGFLLFGFLSGISVFILEVLWLPIAFLMSLILIPIELCSSTSREYDEYEGEMPYWKCCSNYHFSHFWFFPVFRIKRLLR